MVRRPEKRPDDDTTNEGATVTDQDKNLQVVTDHIDDLAGRQQTAADRIMGANRMTGDISARIVSTHGVVCSATSLAVAAADEARKTAGAAIQTTSSELALKLTTAALNYNDTDYRAGKSLGQACQF
jgi:hypothetical protein